MTTERSSIRFVPSRLRSSSSSSSRPARLHHAGVHRGRRRQFSISSVVGPLLPRFPPRFLPPATAVAFPFVRLLLLRSDLVRSVHRLVGPRPARSSICPCWCLKLSVGTASRCFNLRPKHAPRNASMQRPSIIYPAPRAPRASSKADLSSLPRRAPPAHVARPTVARPHTWPGQRPAAPAASPSRRVRRDGWGGC